jgi:hypothetical protein
VTTVVPGLMRTGSHLQARFTGQASKEFTWFGLGASLPVISMDAERAARQIVQAVRARRAEIILTPLGQVASRVAGLASGLTSEVLHLVQQVALPAPGRQAASSAAGARDEGIPGHQLDPAFSRKAFDRLAALGRAAASRHTPVSFRILAASQPFWPGSDRTAALSQAGVICAVHSGRRCAGSGCSGPQRAPRSLQEIRTAR